MFNVKNIIVTTVLVLIYTNLNSQQNIKFCLIFNDSKLTKEDVKSKVNFILETSNVKKSAFEIIHFSSKHEDPDNWSHKKSQVNYKPTKKDCSFDLCKDIVPILSYAKTEKSRIYSDRKTKCDLQIESILLRDSEQSSICEKINEEIVRLSKLKTNNTVFFLFDRDQINESISVYFEQEKIKVIEGETLRLNPIISGKNTIIKWLPEKGLSCSDCMNPELKVVESMTYECTVTDSLGCFAQKKNIEIQVEKRCNCKTMPKNELLLKNHPDRKIIKNTKGTMPEWELISKESGDFIFDVVVKPNCADSFQVKIVNQDYQVFYNMIYQRDEIEYSSTKHYFLRNLNDHFVLRFDISDQKKEMQKQIHDYFRIIISPYVNGLECLSAKYESPRLEFSPCPSHE
jgi:hypothetical protein